MPINAVYSQTYSSGTFFPHSVLNKWDIAETASKIYPLLSYTNHPDEILISLKVRGFHSKSAQAEVFIKVFQILEIQSTFEKFSPNFKEKLSIFFSLLTIQFPEINFKDYFINFGPNPEIPKDAPDDLIEKIRNSKFAVTLNMSSIEHMIRNYIVLDTHRQSYIQNVLFMEMSKLHEGLEKIPKNTCTALIITHPNKHVSLLLIKHEPTQMNFIVVETLANGFYKYRPTTEVNSPPVQMVIDIIARKFVQNIPTKISYFRLNRQKDVTSCPIFLLSDLTWCFAFNMFDYVNYIEKFYPQKIIQSPIPTEKKMTIQAVPTHPSLLLSIQSVQFFELAKEILDRNEIEPFDRDFSYRFIKQEFFDYSLRTSLLPVEPEKYMNFRIHITFMEYAKKIIADLFKPYTSTDR